MSYKLLSLTQPKIDKSNKLSNKYRTAILHLAPGKLSGVNLCPFATEGCLAACLNTAGLGGVYPAIQTARIIKSIHFNLAKDGFLSQLNKEILKFIDLCKRDGLRAAIRLNGTSDIFWERYLDLGNYDAQFYDYTKAPFDLRESRPKNYHLTRSYSENMGIMTLYDSVEYGMNVAVVFRHTIPERYLRLKVIDGTLHDLSFLDPYGVIVGLKALGKARHDYTGFVVDAP